MQTQDNRYDKKKADRFDIFAQLDNAALTRIDMINTVYLKAKFTKNFEFQYKIAVSGYVYQT